MRKIASLFLSTVIVLLLWSFNNDPLAESMARGEELYMEYCMTCHMTTGEGVAGVFPPLAESDYLMADVERAIQVVKYGQSGALVVNGESYNNFMPAPGLDDDEVADVVNFILNSWGNEYGKLISEEEVAKISQP